jgi:monoamine oxidase
MLTDTIGADVVIVGGGVAGLAAARALVEAGARICLVEARDRLGGRIDTRYEPGVPWPIELGAEFVHGLPDEVLALVRRGAISLQEVSGRRWQFHGGVLAPVAGGWAAVDEIFERLQEAARTGPDLSFRDFLQRWCAEPRLREACLQAEQFVQGYHAARPERISVRSLALAEQADEAIQAHRQFRVAGGYARVVEWLRAGLPEAPETLRLETVATGLRWQPGEVRLELRGPAGPLAPITARRALITLPLGVLQQPPDAPGALRFSPPLPSKDAAVRGLAMGAVVKIVLVFQEDFWQGVVARPGMSFLRAAGEQFPTWWTPAPAKAPVLAGWVGGPQAEALSAQPAPCVLDAALQTLSHVFGATTQHLAGGVRSWHYHNWQQDPFARGAYSYVVAGGLPCQRELALPVEDTLFFAGEATEWSGHYSTVHGAMATGRRAALEILASLGRDAPRTPPS